MPALWHEHQSSPFPQDALGLTYRGSTLLRLDARVGALLTASLKTDGRPRALPGKNQAELGHLRGEIADLLRDLPLALAAREYFVRLEALSAAVLAVKAPE